MRIIQDDTNFQGRVSFANIPIINTDIFKNTATPSVNGREKLICSGSVVTITNFLFPADGQSISLLGDGTTTISNNTNIKTNTGANKLLSTNKVYRFTYFDSKKLWVEDA